MFTETEKWANAPEYVRPRSKYYYFYEWMRERISDHFPHLPQPIMDKLLAMDAGELDLLLRYPKAIRGQVRVNSIPPVPKYPVTTQIHPKC